jgi:hypothetical protein
MKFKAQLVAHAKDGLTFSRSVNRTLRLGGDAIRNATCTRRRAAHL